MRVGLGGPPELSPMALSHHLWTALCCSKLANVALLGGSTSVVPGREHLGRVPRAGHRQRVGYSSRKSAGLPRTSPGLQDPHKEDCLGQEQGETCPAVAARGRMNGPRQRPAVLSSCSSLRLYLSLTWGMPRPPPP